MLSYIILILTMMILDICKFLWSGKPILHMDRTIWYVGSSSILATVTAPLPLFFLCAQLPILLSYYILASILAPVTAFLPLCHTLFSAHSCLRFPVTRVNTVNSVIAVNSVNTVNTFSQQSQQSQLSRFSQLTQHNQHIQSTESTQSTQSAQSTHQLSQLCQLSQLSQHIQSTHLNQFFSVNFSVSTVSTFSQAKYLT